jgi:hypothetical protein
MDSPACCCIIPCCLRWEGRIGKRSMCAPCKKLEGDSTPIAYTAISCETCQSTGPNKVWVGTQSTGWATKFPTRPTARNDTLLRLQSLRFEEVFEKCSGLACRWEIKHTSGVSKHTGILCNWQHYLRQGSPTSYGWQATRSLPIIAGNVSIY